MPRRTRRTEARVIYHASAPTATPPHGSDDGHRSSPSLHALVAGSTPIHCPMCRACIISTRRTHPTWHVALTAWRLPRFTLAPRRPAPPLRLSARAVPRTRRREATGWRTAPPCTPPVPRVSAGHGTPSGVERRGAAAAGGGGGCVTQRRKGAPEGRPVRAAKGKQDGRSATFHPCRLPRTPTAPFI